jgi:hypothetical protein
MVRLSRLAVTMHWLSLDHSGSSLGPRPARSGDPQKAQLPTLFSPFALTAGGTPAVPVKSPSSDGGFERSHAPRFLRA